MSSPSIIAIRPSPSEVAMTKLGAQLGGALVDENRLQSQSKSQTQFQSPKGSLICLDGPLGAGKTTFVRGLIRALTQPDEEIPSPSFALIQLYKTLKARPGWPIYHIDLFRLQSSDEIRELGIEEALEDGLVLIEWPEKALATLAVGYRNAALHIRIDGDIDRRVTFSACDRPHWQSVIDAAFGTEA